MNSRDFSSIYDQLFHLLGVKLLGASPEFKKSADEIKDAIAALDLKTIGVKLERIVTDKDQTIFRKETVDKFIASKQNDGRYKITVDDSDLINNIKSLFNLLQSFTAIPKEFLQKVLETTEEGGLKAIWNHGEVIAKGAWNIQPILQTKNDTQAFIFYLGKLSELLPNIPAISQEAKRKIKQVQQVFIESKLNNAIVLVNLARNSKYKKSMKVLVPDINAGELLNNIDNFGLKNHLAALSETLTAMIPQEPDLTKKDRYTIRELSFGEIDNENEMKRAYNACRDLEDAIKESILLTCKIMNSPLYGFPGIKWKHLDSETRADYIKLGENIRNIAMNITAVDLLCEKMPELHEILHRDKKRVNEQLNGLRQWIASPACTAIDELNQSFGVEDAIRMAGELAEDGITAEDKAKYFNQPGLENLFKIPSENSGELTPHKRNLMRIVNISSRALTTLQRVTDASNHFTLDKIPGLLGLLSEIGEMMKDYNAIDNIDMVNQTREDIAKNINKILKKLLPVFNKAVMSSIEVEIKLDLSYSVLTSKLYPVADEIIKLSKMVSDASANHKFHIDVSKVAKPPFIQEKSAVINKIMGESRDRLHKLNEIRAYFTENSAFKPPYLVELLKMMEQAKLVKSINSAELCSYLEGVIAKITGKDLLDDAIRVNEEKILGYAHDIQSTDLYALLTDHDEAIIKTAARPEVKEIITELKNQYLLRNEIQAMIKHVDENKYNDAAIRDTIICKISKVENTGIFSRVKNYFKSSGMLELTPGEDSRKTQLKQLPHFNEMIQIDIECMIAKEQKMVDDLHNMKRFIGLPDDAKPDLLIDDLAASTNSSILADAYSTDLPEADFDLFAERPKAKEKDEIEMHEIIESNSSKIVDDDETIIKQIIDTAKGEQIIQLELLRANLIKHQRNILDKSQSDLLDREYLVNGLYELNDNDHLMVMSIKSLYNTMIKAERLLEAMNQLGSRLAGGKLDKISTLKLIAPLERKITELKYEIIKTNDVLYVLRGNIQHGVFDAVKNNFGQLFDKISDLPARLSALGGNVQLEFADALKPGSKQAAQELMTAANKLIVDNNNQAPLDHTDETFKQDIIGYTGRAYEAIKINLVKLQAQFNMMRDNIASMPKHADGTYDLNHLPENSAEKRVAALINASYKLNNVLHAMENMANGNKISGFMAVVTNLLAARSNLNASNALEAATADANVVFDNAAKELNAQINGVLLSLKPIVMELIAQTALMESTLGLKKGTLLKKVEHYFNMYLDLAEQNNTRGLNDMRENYPYLDIQITLARKEKLRLEIESKQPNCNFALYEKVLLAQNKVIADLENRQKQPVMIPFADESSDIDYKSKDKAESQDSEMIPLIEYQHEDKEKLSALKKACLNYKSHLATAINRELEKAHPGNRYGSIDIKKPYEPNANIQMSSTLRLAIDKYNIVHALQQTLKQPDKSNSAKFYDFRVCLQANKNTLNKRRDSAGMTFAKVLLSIFTFGIAAAIPGIWRTKGKQTTNQLEKTLDKSDEKPARQMGIYKRVKE